MLTKDPGRQLTAKWLPTSHVMHSVRRLASVLQRYRQPHLDLAQEARKADAEDSQEKEVRPLRLEVRVLTQGRLFRQHDAHYDTSLP